MRVSKTGRKRKDGIVNVQGKAMTSQEQRVLASRRAADLRRMPEYYVMQAKILRQTDPVYWTYTRLAKYLGVSKSSIYRYLTGVKR